MIEVGVASSALSGRSGDRAVVVGTDDRTLVVAIDGLGHGDLAADAAERAAAVLEAGGGLALEELLRRSHEALVGSRGAVMTLAEFRADPDEVHWVGVGNVEARLLPVGVAPTLFGGVVGHNLPTVRTSSQPLQDGDLLVMATDGVRADFADGLSTAGEPQAIADRVLAAAGRGVDDALVVVVRFRGDAHDPEL